MGAAIKALFLATGILALSGTAGLAGPMPGNNVMDSPLHYPGAPKPPDNDQPYAMNYADEVAQALGVRDGHMDLFSSRPAPNDPWIPVMSGGLGRDGAMLKLQWRPGL